MKLSRTDLDAMIGEAVKSGVAAALKESGVDEPQRQHMDQYGWRASRHKRYMDKLSEKPVHEMSLEDKGLMWARSIKFLMRCNWDYEKAHSAAKACGEKTLMEVFEKQLGESVFADGGALLPTEFSESVIELLAPMSVVMASGVSVMPMNTGSLSLPFIDTGSTATWVGENVNEGGQLEDLKSLINGLVMSGVESVTGRRV